MSYLQDKEAKRKNLFRWGIFFVVLIFLIYFRTPIFRGFSYVAQAVFRPFLSAGGSVGGTFSSLGGYFQFKKALERENESLKLELADMSAKLANYNTILDENLKLKEIMGRGGERNDFLIAAILGRPNNSPYDTLIIDAGSSHGVSVGDLVMAYGDVPIGRVSDVYPGTSKVILFSNPGQKTEVLVSGRDIFMQLVGRGGGNFEMILPRELTLEIGTEVHLPVLTPQVLAKVETIISDPRDAFQKALLVAPVNIQELKFVEVFN